MAARPPGVTGTRPANQQANGKSEVKDLGPGSLCGNLTGDVELRFTSSGIPVASLRVATADRVQDKRTGKWTETPTEYFTVECWRRLAEHAAEHLARGNRIIAEGEWKSASWTDKEGEVKERIFLAARELGPSLLFTGARVLDRPKGGK